MKWTFPYKKFPCTDAPSGYSYAAVVPVSIALPAKHAIRSKRIEAIVDSGASLSMFQAQVGEAVGVDIKAGTLVQTQGIAGPTNVYVHDVALYIPGGVVQTKVSFSYDLPVIGLLGMEGFFDHFLVMFDPTAMHCEIERLFRA